MKDENAHTLFFHWWGGGLGNDIVGYVTKVPSRSEIVDAFLVKYPIHSKNRQALVTFAETKEDYMLQMWPGWKDGPAPRKA